jgi:hypothetical protein
MALSTIAITDGDGGHRLATAEITQGGETVSLTRVVLENFADAAPDTFGVVVLPVPAAAKGDLALVWGANGSDRRICIPRIEVQQIGAATTNTLIRISVLPQSVQGDAGVRAREVGQLLVPQPVDPRGPLTMIGVNENTYPGTVTHVSDAYGGLQAGDDFLYGLVPDVPDDLAPGPIDPYNLISYTAQRYAIKPMALSTDVADFQTLVFDFAKSGQYPTVLGGAGISIQTDADMNDAELLVRITLMQSEV